MFARSLRLSRAGFERTRSLRRASAPHFSVSYGSLGQDAGLGVIVPKKVVKSAVARHRLKRRLREILRTLAATGGLPSVIIVSARTGADSLTYAHMSDELSEAFKAILAENA